MNYIDAKKLITTIKHPEGWFGSNYNMNIYRGCSHSCIYCDSRSTVYRVFDFEDVKVKRDVPLLLEEELRTKRKTGMVSLGAMSDPYNPQEERLKLTRESFKLFNKYGFGVNVVTKSDLVVRDIDLLLNMNEHSRVIVLITITCASDELALKLEPGAPSTSRRFEALRKLKEAGIFCGVAIMPILPFVNDDIENIKGLLEKANEVGVDFISASFAVTMRDGQREYLYKKLDEHFPGVKERYIKLFGRDYGAPSPNREILWDYTARFCRENNIIFKMKEISKEAYNRVGNQQLKLF